MFKMFPFHHRTRFLDVRAQAQRGCNRSHGDREEMKAQGFHLCKPSSGQMFLERLHQDGIHQPDRRRRAANPTWMRRCLR